MSYIHIYMLYIHISMVYKERSGTGEGLDFGTDRPSQDRNGHHNKPDQTRPDWLWRGTERTGFMRNGSIFGP